jgi:hypothetical protein
MKLLAAMAYSLRHPLLPSALAGRITQSYQTN